MGGQEGSDPKSLVRGLELNAMGTRESAGILCRGGTRVDSGSYGRGRMGGRKAPCGELGLRARPEGEPELCLLSVV